MRLRNEALNTHVEQHEFGVNFLLRAIVERIMYRFAKGRGVWKPQMSTKELQEVCVPELQKLRVGKKIWEVVEKSMKEESTPYGLYALGFVVHGNQVPVADNLKAHFDTWQPALRAMLDAVND